MLRQLVDPLCLRRPRSLLGGQVLPGGEVRIPVRLTSAQVAAYRTVLARSYELLSDPKPSRHSGYRAAQLRNVATELRNVCCHPSLSEWAERPGGAAAQGGGAEQQPAAAAAPAATAALAAAGAASVALASVAGGAHHTEGEGGARLGAERLVQGSAKLSLLDCMLRQLHTEGKRVMVLAQSSKSLDAVEQLALERYGGSSTSGTATGTAAAQPCYERVDCTTKTAQRQEAVARFNAACQPEGDASRWLFLQHTHSCGVGTDLPGIDVVVFLDSDWSARKDVQVSIDAVEGGVWSLWLAVV